METGVGGGRCLYTYKYNRNRSFTNPYLPFLLEVFPLMFLFYSISVREKNYWLRPTKLISWSTNRLLSSIWKNTRFHSFYSHKEIIPFFSEALLSILYMKILLSACFDLGVPKFLFFFFSFFLPKQKLETLLKCSILDAHPDIYFCSSIVGPRKMHL